MKFQVLLDFIFFKLTKPLWGGEFGSVELRATVGVMQWEGQHRVLGGFWGAASAAVPLLPGKGRGSIPRAMEVPNPSPASCEIMLLPQKGRDLGLDGDSVGI